MGSKIRHPHSYLACLYFLRYKQLVNKNPYYRFYQIYILLTNLQVGQ